MYDTDTASLRVIFIISSFLYLLVRGGLLLICKHRKMWQEIYNPFYIGWYFHFDEIGSTLSNHH